MSLSLEEDFRKRIRDALATDPASMDLRVYGKEAMNEETPRDPDHARCPQPCSDLFGVGGRRLLARLDLADPWRSTTLASLALIDLLDREITGIERELRALGADHRYIPLLVSCPGIAWILSIACSLICLRALQDAF